MNSQTKWETQVKMSFGEEKTCIFGPSLKKNKKYILINVKIATKNDCLILTNEKKKKMSYNVET